MTFFILPLLFYPVTPGQFGSREAVTAEYLKLLEQNCFTGLCLGWHGTNGVKAMQNNVI